MQPVLSPPPETREILPLRGVRRVQRPTAEIKPIALRILQQKLDRLDRERRTVQKAIAQIEQEQRATLSFLR